MSVEIVTRSGCVVRPNEDLKVIEDRLKAAIKAKAWGIEVHTVYDGKVMVSLHAIDFVKFD